MARDLHEELRELIGLEGPRLEALDEVCRPLIRQWCAAMQDGNLLYTDEEYARKSKYGSVIAPPTMLMAWSMNPLWPPRESVSSSLGRVMEILDKAGFTQVMIVGSTQKYYRPLFPGDRVSFTHSVDSVSDEKQTGLGRGYFVTSIFTYSNQKGDLIGTQSLTMLKYRVEP
jgi:acyl dehydratase